MERKKWNSIIVILDRNFVSKIIFNYLSIYIHFVHIFVHSFLPYMGVFSVKIIHVFDFSVITNYEPYHLVDV
jgi:hypothetical protein